MKKTILLIFCISYLVGFSQKKDSITFFKKMYNSEISDSSKFVITTKIAKLFKKINKDSARFYYEKAYNFTVEINNKNLEGDALINLGLFDFSSRVYINSIKHFKKALKICEQKLDKNKEAKVYNHLGYCYMYLYDENNSFENFIKSLSISKEISNKKRITDNYSGIGTLFYDQENYELAQKYYADALAINLKLNDSSKIANNYIDLGNALSDGGNLKKGLEYYQKSIEILKKIKDNIGLGINYNNISDSYKELKDYKKANSFLSKALTLAKKENDKRLLSIIYLNKANIEAILNHKKLAIKYAIISIKYAKEIKALKYIAEDYKTLSKAYKAIGNLNKAFYYNEKYSNLHDSLAKFDKHKTALLFKSLSELEKTNLKVDKLAIENARVIAKNKDEKKFIYGLIIAMTIFAFLLILINRQYSKKQEAYNLLEYQNFKINEMHDEIEKQKNYLEKLNNTKDKFFSIIAHDLKNPFNSIKGFTELLLENGDSYTEERKRKFLKIIASSTTKASELLNNLLIWANSQSGKIQFNPEKLNLNKQIENVCTFLGAQALSKEVEIKTNLKPNIFVFADKNMINTALRNLISNAIKFTNKNGLIEVTSKENEQEIVVEVKDNGIGISKEEIENLFSLDSKQTHVGTANEQGTGLGLLLCYEFIKKNKGELTVTSELNKGSIFKFTLPKL
jgi:signal transduction histidine kinase